MLHLQLAFVLFVASLCSKLCVAIFHMSNLLLYNPSTASVILYGIVLCYCAMYTYIICFIHSCRLRRGRTEYWRSGCHHCGQPGSSSLGRLHLWPLSLCGVSHEAKNA